MFWFLRTSAHAMLTMAEGGCGAGAGTNRTDAWYASQRWLWFVLQMTRAAFMGASVGQFDAVNLPPATSTCRHRCQIHRWSDVLPCA